MRHLKMEIRATFKLKPFSAILVPVDVIVAWGPLYGDDDVKCEANNYIDVLQPS